MTGPEKVAGVELDMYWVLGTLGKSIVRIVLLFLLFTGLVVGFTILNNMILHDKDNGSGPAVQIKATMVINPQFLVIHDYLDLNFYNQAWYVSATEKEIENIRKETGMILGHEVSNEDLKVLDNMITVNKETGTIFFVWNSKNEALSEANLKAYTNILMEHLRRTSLKRIERFIAGPRSGKPLETAVYEYAKECSVSIQDGTLDVVALEIQKRSLGSSGLLPGAVYSGTIGFWVILLLSCLFAAILTVLLWSYCGEMLNQKRRIEGEPK